MSLRHPPTPGTCILSVPDGTARLDVQSGTINVAERTIHMVIAGTQGSIQFDGSTSG